MPSHSSFVIHAGTAARARIARDGLSAADVGIVPAAAGGPKGLILHHLDRHVFGRWLPTEPRKRTLIGASIGAWRMAAAAHADPLAAFDRLTDAYCGQRYSPRPPPAEVSRVCRGMVADILLSGTAGPLVHPDHGLVILTVRGKGPLANPARRGAEFAGFALATLLNATRRSQLARFLERVAFVSAAAETGWLRRRFDAFATELVELDGANLDAALLASGTIPFVLAPVRDIPGARPGSFWDGGMIDYHLHLPYPDSQGLVFYPHFTDHMIPGWLDKMLKWRRARGAWLDNVVLLSPSPEFVATLPNAKLPDRSDFKRYGTDEDGRERAWRRAIAEGERIAEDFARWREAPDPRMVRPFPA